MVRYRRVHQIIPCSAAAAELKRAEPGVTAFTYQGDGDAYNIGLCETLAALNKCRLAFNVNSLAMAAAMEDEEHIRRTVDVNYQSLDPDQHRYGCTDGEIPGGTHKSAGTAVNCRT